MSRFSAYTTAAMVGCVILFLGVFTVANQIYSLIEAIGVRHV